MWPSQTKADQDGSYEIIGCPNTECLIEPTTEEYLPYGEALRRWNTRPTPAPCDELETVGWLWEYAQYRTDERGYYGYETVITENNPTDHVSPAEKLRNIRELVTRQNAEEVIAAERLKLEAENASLIHDLNRIKDHETALVNDNAAKDARIAEMEELLERTDRFAKKYLRHMKNTDKRNEALEADNKRLREALEPFADVAEHDIGGDEDDRAVFWPISSERHSKAGRFRVGDLRRARTALRERE